MVPRLCMRNVKDSKEVGIVEEIRAVRSTCVFGENEVYFRSLRVGTGFRLTPRATSSFLT